MSNIYNVNDLTDEELCMLEQLTYIDEDVAFLAFDTPKFTKINKGHIGRTISEILEDFDEEALIRLRHHSENICDAAMSGVEWAGVIEYLKNPENRLSHLVLKDNIMFDETGWHSKTILGSDTGNYPLALTFAFKGDDNNAVVAFKGTTGPEEWVDNFESCRMAETPTQIRALDYINSLDYNKVVVTGHSKGSNKAMYVTILSDKVSKCVGFDGEGFSEQFQNKYRDQIKDRSKYIKNYSLAGDFVHILMDQLPASKQVYCQGFRVDSISENHSPVSFFELPYTYTEIEPAFSIVDEPYAIRHLHKFIAELLSDVENNDIIDYLINTVPELLLKVEKDGNEYNKVEKVDSGKILFEDNDGCEIIGKFAAQFINYMQRNNLGEQYFKDLFDAWEQSFSGSIVKAIATGIEVQSSFVVFIMEFTYMCSYGTTNGFKITGSNLVDASEAMLIIEGLINLVRNKPLRTLIDAGLILIIDKYSDYIEEIVDETLLDLKYDHFLESDYKELHDFINSTTFKSIIHNDKRLNEINSRTL